jgi:hypothetical protein
MKIDTPGKEVLVKFIFSTLIMLSLVTSFGGGEYGEWISFKVGIVLLWLVYLVATVSSPRHND